MTISSLERRIRKVEAQRRSGGDTALFFVFGRTEDEITATIKGLNVRPAEILSALWHLPEAVPEPRWSTVAGLTDRELENLIVHVKQVEMPDDPSWSTERVRAMSDADLSEAVFADIASEQSWRAQ